MVGLNGELLEKLPGSLCQPHFMNYILETNIQIYLMNAVLMNLISKTNESFSSAAMLN